MGCSGLLIATPKMCERSTDRADLGRQKETCARSRRLETERDAITVIIPVYANARKHDTFK